MSAHTKKRPTEGYDEVSFTGPAKTIKKAREYLKKMGLTETTDLIDANRVFMEHSPARLLSGARYREQLTQAQLAALTGISRKHISEMENGKRIIDEENAKLLAKALGVDYNRLL